MASKYHMTIEDAEAFKARLYASIEGPEKSQEKREAAIAALCAIGIPRSMAETAVAAAPVTSSERPLDVVQSLTEDQLLDLVALGASALPSRLRQEDKRATTSEDTVSDTPTA
jgi:hypothetical protein